MITVSEAQLVAWLTPLLWPFLRALALFSAMPVLGGRNVPMRVRIGLAAFIWLKRREIADALAHRFASLHRVLMNKYYVDELYDRVVIRPALGIGRLFSFFDGRVIDKLVEFAGTAARAVANVDDAIDKYLVDGAVNAVANATLDGGRALRRVQTGRVQTYLYGALAGGLAIIVLNFIVG